MLLKVTHIDRAGHRHKALVTARSVADAMDQMDQVFGEPLRVACLRLTGRPALRVVASGSKTGRTLCAAGC